MVSDDPESTRSEASPPPSKTSYVLRRIREDIASGNVAPGKPLRQTDLAARYGFSATPVREALRLLEADGTITYSPHRGATVRGLSPEAVSDLYEMRARTEGFAAELAAARITPEQLERIESMHRNFLEVRPSADAAEMTARNRDLHFAIYETGSPLIANFVRQIWAMLPSRSTIWVVPHQAERLEREHAAIIDALALGDSELARERMIAHLHTAREYRQAETLRPLPEV